RCVKPPIIYGDVYRPEPMTVEVARYAQSLTDKPVKGMLTGPVTMLQWSFVRDDQPREETCRQLALAIRDETVDLEAAGIGVIQIDEPAIREGLPLRVDDRSADVLSIETSRSDMVLLETFAHVDYPNGVGPGVYDVHSPAVPAVADIEALLHKALAVLSPDQLWVNPDCGLKTRRWEEVRPAMAA